MKAILKTAINLLLVLTLISLLGCAQDASKDNPDAGNDPSLNQAAFVSATSTYQFGHNSIPNIKITGAPADTDFSRWAMLHDGSAFRLYFFAQEKNDTMYQFSFNATTQAYEFGFNSIDVLKITGAPSDADPSSFAMLHDGSTYRLYMLSKTTRHLYQFAFNRSSSDYEFGHNSIPKMALTNAPADVDFERWAMLHDGSAFRFYAFQDDSDVSFYQFAFNISTSSYEFGFNSIDILSLDLTPANSDTDSFAMLHDGSDYRFYFLTE